MPTECERSLTSPTAPVPTTTTTIPSFDSNLAASEATAAHFEHMDDIKSDGNIMDKDMLNGEMSTSTGSTESATNGHNGSNNNGGRKTSLTSPDPTAYVAKARVTRPTPPPPSYNPMQFVQIKPCNLYQTAQQQLKKAEEVKKIKEIKKEEPEDWQNNLDNWKSSRRKRVEHIIDRVVEVKKLELEEHDRSRRKSKTFSEMIEERGDRPPRAGRAKLVSLAVYNEDESNDLSDLGIGTSSASGKSSLSEDYDNNSVMSDNADLDKVIYDNNHLQSSTTREYISSPGYDTSSSTAPASSPDPCEYTYEGAIQDYKQRVSRATCGGSTGFKLNQNQPKTLTTTKTSKETTPERGSTPNNSVMTSTETYAARRGSKIEERLIGFEVNSPNDSQDVLEKNKVDVPKIDISKRKEMFEAANNEPLKSQGNISNGVPKLTLRDRFKVDAEIQQPAAKREVKRLSGDVSSIKDRLQSLEQQQNVVNSTNGAAKATTSKLVDIPVPPLKERLSSLQNAVTKEEIKKPPVVLVDARQLEIMKDEDETAKQRIKQLLEVQPAAAAPPLCAVVLKEEVEVDRDDSGIHTSDDIDEEQQQLLQLTQEQQLNEAIAALALEEKQLEEAANAVNLIEAEFAELSSQAVAPAAATTTNEMEFSINEALELALEAIDKETTTTTTTITTKISTEISTTTTTNDSTDDNCNNNTIAIATSNKINNFNSEHKKHNNEKLNETEENSHVPILTQVDTEELIIQNEPIYENISATSTPPVDVEVKIIPNNLNKLKNNQQNINKSNNSKNNNNKNSIKNSNNNKPLVDITNSLTTSHATVEMLQATSNKIETNALEQQQHQQQLETHTMTAIISANVAAEDEPYYQVPKSSEPYYDAPKHLRPIPLYENIEIFYNGLESATLAVNSVGNIGGKMEPPKEKPPPPPIDSPPAFDDLDGHETGLDNWSSDNTYETISNRLPNGNDPHPSPPIKRMNSTKRIKKELRNKRSSFLGIEGTTDDDLESYLELTVAPPPDMAQLLQEERRLEKQLYMKAGLCDSSDTGESRDSGVSENHSRQSSEPYTNSSEEADRNDEAPLSLNTNSNHIIKQDELIYQNGPQLLVATQTPLLQTVKGNSAESWTESATAAAAATKSLTEATATANAKMLSIEEKIREQEEVLRVERELLQLEQEELKRQRENLMLRENIARRELQHGAKMLMSANRQSLQDINVSGSGSPAAHVTMQHVLPQQLPQQQQIHHQQAQPQQQQQHQQIYANVPNLQQQYYQVETDYRKSMSDLNEFSKRLMLPTAAPLPPTKPMRAMHVAHADVEYSTRQRHSLNTQSYGGSLVKIAGTPITTAMVAQRQSNGVGGAIYSNYQQQQHHQSAQNLATATATATTNGHAAHTNMTRNTLHALSATPKPKYTDGWVQVQNRKSYDSNLSNDPAWLSAYQQKRKSVPESYLYNNNMGSNHWLVQEAEQRRLAEQQQHQQQHRRSHNTTTTNAQQQNGVSGANKSSGKPLPDSIIQSLTERVQSKGIGERKRFDNYSNNIEKSPMHASNAASYHLQQQQQQQLHPSAAPRHAHDLSIHSHNSATTTSLSTTPGAAAQQDKVLSVSGKKKCSHCGDELGRGAAMIIESLLLFYHINCFKCCVCHVQLGDGLNGTDVRVRNHKLHCQNCYSSDDGIKFSCV